MMEIAVYILHRPMGILHIKISSKTRIFALVTCFFLGLAFFVGYKREVMYIPLPVRGVKWLFSKGRGAKEKNCHVLEI